MNQGNPNESFDFVNDGLIITVSKSVVYEGNIVGIEVREYADNSRRLDFSYSRCQIGGEALYDSMKKIRQCYLISEYFLLLITDDYFELINTLRYNPSPGSTVRSVEGDQANIEQRKKKQYFNSRTVFHSNVLRGLFARGGVVEALDRYKKTLFFRVKSSESEDEEYYELDIRRIY